MIAFARQQQPLSSRGWKRRFLQLLPRIRSHARFACRSLNASEREEALVEVVASSFCAFRRLVRLGKAEMAYATSLARYAVAQYRAGRRVASSMNAGDVLGPVAAYRKRVRIVSLDLKDPDDRWAESLVDNIQSPVVDQVAFRVDFPEWLDRLSQRDRRLATLLAVGNSPSEAAHELGLSRSRVSQRREALRASWQAFHGDVEMSAAETHVSRRRWYAN